MVGLPPNLMDLKDLKDLNDQPTCVADVLCSLKLQ